MNFTNQAIAFIDKAATDPRLAPCHVSLYLSILRNWEVEQHLNALRVQRNKLMIWAKIGCRTTYQKCIRDLHVFGYIRYESSCSRVKGSFIYLTASDGVTPLIDPKVNRYELLFNLH